MTEAIRFMKRAARDLIYTRSNGICGICHEPVARRDMSIDHIYPISRGGENSIENCQASHWACNKAKGNSTSTEPRTTFKKGTGKGNWKKMKTISIDVETAVLVEELRNVTRLSKTEIARQAFAMFRDTLEKSGIPIVVTQNLPELKNKEVQ